MKFFIDTANLAQIKEAQAFRCIGWSYYKSVIDGKRRYCGVKTIS